MNHMISRAFLISSLITGLVTTAHASEEVSPTSGDTKVSTFTLTPAGFAQWRYSLNVPENGEKVHNFDLGLARVAMSGSLLDPHVSYFFQIEGSTFGNGNSISMLDWWMQYSVSEWLNVQVGRFILPYSRQFYTHPGQLLMTDLAEADYAFNLTRAIGAHVHGRILGRISYHVAVLNSVRALDGGGQQNKTDELAGLARIEVDVLNAYGYLETSPDGASKPQLSVGLAIAFNPIEDPSSFQNVVASDSTRNLTADLGFRYGRVSAQAAIYLRRNETADDRSLTDIGYYAQLGVYIVPARLELTARYSAVDFDAANNPAVVGDVSEAIGGLNAYLLGHSIKLQLDGGLVQRKLFGGGTENGTRIRLQTQVMF